MKLVMVNTVDSLSK